MKSISKRNMGLLMAVSMGYKFENGVLFSWNGKILNPSINNGYLRFSMRVYDRVYRVPLHRLVAYQKFGNKIFEEGIVVRHLNGCSTDNKDSNIEIGTQSDNCLDIPAEIRFKKAVFAASFLIKYDARSVKDYYDSCKSYKQTMMKFSMSSKGTLFAILRRA